MTAGFVNNVEFAHQTVSVTWTDGAERQLTDIGNTFKIPLPVQTRAMRYAEMKAIADEMSGLMTLTTIGYNPTCYITTVLPGDVRAAFRAVCPEYKERIPE